MILASSSFALIAMQGDAEIPSAIIKLKTNEKRHAGDQFAQQNPWYRRFQNVFIPKFTEKHSLDHKTHFHFPLPQKGIPVLILDYLTKGINERESEEKWESDWGNGWWRSGPSGDWEILANGISQLNSDAINLNILNALSKVDAHFLAFGNPIIEWKRKDLVLQLLKDWTLRQPGGQKTWFGLYLSSAPYGNYIERVTYYYQINPGEAAAHVERIFTEYIRTNGINDKVIRLLAQLLKLNRILFDERALHILNYHLAHFIVFLANPDGLKQFEGTALSIANLIERAFQNSANRIENESLQCFLQYGTAFHELYKDRIIAVLPEIKHWYSLYETVLSLLKSPSEEVRVKTFQILVKDLSSLEFVPDVDVTVFAKQFFAKDLSGILPDDQTGSAAYKYCYQEFKKNNAVHALQCMKEHFEQTHDMLTYDLIVASCNQ